MERIPSVDWKAVRHFRTAGSKIVCVGRNYHTRVAETGDPAPEKPLLCMKPISSFLSEGKPIIIPHDCECLVHEVALALIIGVDAYQIETDDEAMEAVAGYALALDMTAQDFIAEAKTKGYPWFLSKAFDTSCPISESVPRALLPDPDNLQLWLKVNGVLRQNSNTSDMIFDIATLIRYITRYMTLQPGDVVLTGSPGGVGQVWPGDTIECGLGNLIAMTFNVQSSDD